MMRDNWKRTASIITTAFLVAIVSIQTAYTKEVVPVWGETDQKPINWNDMLDDTPEPFDGYVNPSTHEHAESDRGDNVLTQRRASVDQSADAQSDNQDPNTVTTESSNGGTVDEVNLAVKDDDGLTWAWVRDDLFQDTAFLVITISCASGILLLILVLVVCCCWKSDKDEKSAGSFDYDPGYGSHGPPMDPSVTDRKLAQSAQMFHYQQQKEKMLALEKNQAAKGAAEPDSEDDGAEDTFKVYECAGLAPAGEMEVTNPLYSGDQPSPVSSVVSSGHHSPVTAVPTGSRGNTPTRSRSSISSGSVHSNASVHSTGSGNSRRNK